MCVSVCVTAVLKLHVRCMESVGVLYVVLEKEGDRAVMLSHASR